jgi:phosphatidylinositol alpha-1,6-mannosyltransferase
VGQVQPLRPDPALFAAISRDDRQAARRRLGLARPTVIAVGRLVPIKGFDLLVDACAPPPADGRDGPATGLETDPVADLVILGDGPERRSLELLARRRGVPLRLPGVVPRDEVPLWLAAADVYAQPSRAASSGRTEGLPMASLEALAIGLPVVAARSGGLAELGALGPRVSLFPAGDVRSLRAALRSRLRAQATAAFPS